MYTQSLGMHTQSPGIQSPDMHTKPLDMLMQPLAYRSYLTHKNKPLYTAYIPAEHPQAEGLSHSDVNTCVPDVA